MRRLGLVLLARSSRSRSPPASPAATQTYTSHQLHAPIPSGGTLDPRPQVPDAGPVSFVAVGVRIVAPARRRPDAHARQPGRPQGRRSAGTRAVTARTTAPARRAAAATLAWFESDALDPVSTRGGALRRRVSARAARSPRSTARRPADAGRFSVDDGTPGAAGNASLLAARAEPGTSSRTSASPAAAVAADLSYRETNNSLQRLPHRDRSDGRRPDVHGAGVAASRARTASPGIDTIASPRPLTVRDLDGDGEPEVLVDLYTGGAHCCFYTVILRFDRPHVPRNGCLLGRPRLRPAGPRPRRPARVRLRRRPLRLRVHVLRRVVHCPCRSGTTTTAR